MSKGKKKKTQAAAAKTVIPEKPVSPLKKVLPENWMIWMIVFAFIACVLGVLYPVLWKSMEPLMVKDNPDALKVQIPLWIADTFMPVFTCAAFIFGALGKKILCYVCALLNMVFPAISSIAGCYGIAEVILFGGGAMLLGCLVTLLNRGYKGKGLPYALLTLAGFAIVIYFAMVVSNGVVGVVYATADVKGAYVAMVGFWGMPVFYFLIHAIGAWKNVPREKQDAFTRRTLPNHR